MAIANVVLTNTFDEWRTRTNQVIVGLNNLDIVVPDLSDKTNTLYTYANTINDKANVAYIQANTARDHANAAFNRANIAHSQANTARDQANVAFSQANAAFTQANVVYVQANTARDHANAAFNRANIAHSQANTARDQANVAYDQANVAFSQANVAFNQANASFVQANLAFAQANTARNNANSAFVQANLAFVQANTARDRANDAYTITHGRQTVWVPAVAMTPRPTGGPSSGSIQTTTNGVLIRTLNFDTTTSEFAQFSIKMPKRWNEGNISASFTWSHAATTTPFGVTWKLQAISYSDASALDVSFGNGVEVSDTGGTENTLYVSPETNEYTIENTPNENDLIVFQISRNTANTNDNLAVDARLHGVTIFYTSNVATDD